MFPGKKMGGPHFCPDQFLLPLNLHRSVNAKRAMVGSKGVWKVS